MADVQSLAGRGHRRRQMAILAEPLGQHSAQGGVGINHQHTLWMTCGFAHRLLHHPESLNVRDEGLVSEGFVRWPTSPNTAPQASIQPNLTVLSPQSTYQPLPLTYFNLVH